MRSAIIQLLVLAGIALFLIIRLKSVLGTRDGFEKPPAPLPGATARGHKDRPDFEVIEGGPDRDITDHVKDGSDAAKALAAMKLAEPGVTFFAAWDGTSLAAVGALKELDAERGELKSMRAAPGYRGQGAGEAILLHLIEEARRRGYRWLGLETGRPEPFQPAARLYAKHGFRECGPFGDYVSDVFSMFMEKSL